MQQYPITETYLPSFPNTTDPTALEPNQTYPTPTLTLSFT